MGYSKRAIKCKACGKTSLRKVLGKGSSFKDSNIWKCKCGHSEIGEWGKKSLYR